MKQAEWVLTELLMTLSTVYLHIKCVQWELNLHFLDTGIKVFHPHVQFAFTN